MYKSKEKQKEANRLASQKYRAKGMTEGMTEYPAIVKALVDKRPMLEYVSEDLRKKGLARDLRYGVWGPDFEVIGELLEVTA